MNQFIGKTEEQKDNENYTKNFTRVPNILFESYRYITKEEVLLYIRLRYIYWDTKPRYLSLRVLADITGYSTGALSKMLPRLTAVGLIHAEIRKKKGKDGKEKGNPVYHITINDIWEENRKFFTEGYFDPSEVLLVHQMNATCSPNEQDNHEPVHQMNKPVHKMNNLVHQMRQGCSPNEQDQAQNEAHKITYKTSNKTSTQEESITPNIPVSPDNVPPNVGTAHADYPSEQESIDEDETLHRLPAIAKGQNHDTGDTPASNNPGHSRGNRGLSTRNAPGRVDSDQVLQAQAHTAPQGVRTSSARPGRAGDDRVAVANAPAQQSHSAGSRVPPTVVTPEVSPPSTSGALPQRPEQQALLPATEGKQSARQASKRSAKPGKNIPNAIPTAKGPPVEPPADMPWGTRKCLQWFDFWRGAYLIGTYKNSQASTCAKGLAEQYSEEQVKAARADMEAEPYYIARGGCDVCDVAANIHKYLKGRQGQMGVASRAVVLAGYTDYTSGPAIALKPMKRVRT